MQDQNDERDAGDDNEIAWAIMTTVIFEETVADMMQIKIKGGNDSQRKINK